MRKIWEPNEENENCDNDGYREEEEKKIKESLRLKKDLVIPNCTPLT